MEGSIRMLNIIVVRILKDRRKMEQKQFKEIMDTIFVKLTKDRKLFFKKTMNNKQGIYKSKSTPNHINNH